MLPSSKKVSRLLLPGLLLFLTPIFVLAEDDGHLRVMPVDESDRDPSLVQFIDRLRMAVRHHEPERLVELVSPRVYNGLGKESGIQKFAEYWRVDAIDTQIWSVLEPMLELGGGFVRSEKGVQYCMPYVFTEFPDNLDIFEHAAVLEESVQLMSEPSSSSSLLTKLSYNIVRVQDWHSVPDMNQTPDLFWIKVSTLDGQEGFLRRQEIRSPSDYSACFLQNRNGAWTLTSLFSQLD